MKELIYEYKQQLIANNLFNPYIESLFLEVEAYIRINNLEKANEILTEIISYANKEMHRD